jgi:prevent-host-death family protein
VLKQRELPQVEFVTSPDGTPKAVVISIEDWTRISETLKIM